MAIDYDTPSDAVDVNSRSNHSDLPKESPPDRTQLAGDVVPLPMNPGGNVARTGPAGTTKDFDGRIRRSVSDGNSDPNKIKLMPIDTYIGYTKRTGK